MKWYYEVLTLGVWSPRTTSMGKPIDAEAGNGKRAIRASREIAPDLHKLTLDQLRELYSPDGRFQSQTAKD